MLLSLFRAARTQSPRRTPMTRRRSFVPRLDVLEDRSLPSTLTVVNLADSGAGSLRGQLAAATPGDTIDFAPGLSGTLSLGDAITLDRNVSVVGNLDAGGNPLVTLTNWGRDESIDLVVNPGVTASVSGLTLTGATEAAVFNRGNLTLSRVVVTDNWIGHYVAGALPHTGTVYNASGILVVQDSQITNNHLRSLGPSTGWSAGGGGIESSPYYLDAPAPALTVANSTIANNDVWGGADGAGIWISGGTATITGSTIIGNSTEGGGGGGISAEGSATLTVAGSTISGNTAVRGGGLDVFGSDTKSITDSTVSGDTAYEGGGIYFGGGSGFTLASST